MSYIRNLVMVFKYLQYLYKKLSLEFTSVRVEFFYLFYDKKISIKVLGFNDLTFAKNISFSFFFSIFFWDKEDTSVFPKCKGS